MTKEELAAWGAKEQALRAADMAACVERSKQRAAAAGLTMAEAWLAVVAATPSLAKHKPKGGSDK